MKSSIYSLSTPLTVTFAPTVKVYNPDTGTYTAPEGGNVVLEVFLLRNRTPREGNEREGLEVSRSSRLMQIVGTVGDAPLKLPDTLKAGDTGTFTEMGQKQTLTLGSLVPPQISDVADDLGWTYAVSLESVG